MFLHDVAFFLRKRCEVRSNPIEDHKSALEGTLVLGYSKLINSGTKRRHKGALPLVAETVSKQAGIIAKPAGTLDSFRSIPPAYILRH
jgi:hypothetical protein